MATLAEIRQKYPEYNDLSDADLATALHGKFYSDMPFDEFSKRVGLAASQPPEQPRNPLQQFNPIAALNPITAGPEWAKAYHNPSGAWQATDDSVRMLANGATLGFADPIVGYMSGTGTEAERARSATAKERLGVQGDVLEAAGSMIPATKAMQLGLTATRLPRALGKYGGGLLDGMAFGGLQAYGNDKDVMTGMGIGGLAGGVGTAAGSAVEKVLGNKALKAMQAAAPTEEAVATQKNALYSALDNAEVKFDANAYEQMLQDTSAALKNFRATKAPMTADTVQYMSQWRGTSPGFRDVEDILQEAKGILRERNATEADKKAAGIVVGKLSEFFDNAALSTNGSIPAGQVSVMAKQARELARRTIIARDIRNMMDKEDGYLGGAESAARNQFGSYLKSNKRRGLSDAERKAFGKVVRREGLLGVLNQAGTRAGSLLQIGAGTALAIPTSGLSLLGTGAGLLGGFAARKGMERVTSKAVDSATKTVLAGRAAQKAAKPDPEKIKYLNSLLKVGLLGLSGGAIANR